MTELKPYPAYKDSGVPWLGQVPERWDIRSLGSITSTISHHGRPDLPLLSVVREKGVIPRSTMSDEENHNFVPDDLSNYKIVREGNLVVNKMKAWQGSLGIAPMDGIVSPAYFVFDIRIGDRQFAQTLLRSKVYIPFFAQASDGVRIGQWELSVVGMKRIPMVVPPTPEQVGIVRYLDHADRKVWHAIRARQQLIKLLTEQKQAIIQRAVTRGLDPNVRLKPSGVAWLGDVPEHWEIRKVKYVLQPDGYRAGPFGSALITSQLNSSGTIRVLSPEHVARASMSLGIDLFLPEAREREMSQFLVKGRDIVFPIVGTLGRAMVVPRSVGKTIINQRLARLRPDETRVNSDYLALLMSKVTLYQELDRVECKGSILDHITKERILERPLPLPPLLEQMAILNELESAGLSVDKAIDAAHREIDLLREYRTRLIADVVTGKLDVRDVPVPDDETDVLPEELEGIDERDAMDQSDNAAETDSESSTEESA